MSFDPIDPPRRFWDGYQVPAAELLELELQYEQHEAVAARLEEGSELPSDLSAQDEKRLTLILRPRDLVIYRCTDGLVIVVTPEQASRMAAIDEADAAISQGCTQQSSGASR